MVVNEIYPDLHSSHCQYHSTETALLKVMNDVLLKMNLLEAQHLTQLIIIPCWNDCAGMLAYVGKCLTGSAHICRIGASKSPSMGRLLDSSHLTVAYLRVLVWDPCCSSFTLPCCLRLSSITSRTFTVSRTITH